MHAQHPKSAIASIPRLSILQAVVGCWNKATICYTCSLQQILLHSTG